ncbi:MAG TPA: hypothetical protein PKK43_02010 [Spirochaetota bacterium]|nr:hypothetical protein [Spirochaetota bacterium]
MPGSDPEFKWSRTRRTFVYVKKTGDDTLVPCAGEEEISSPDGTPIRLASWSPDGERLAYVTRGESEDDTLVIDGTEKDKFACVFNIFWSPDSKRYAASVHCEDGNYLYIDGKKIGPFGYIDKFVWSAGSSKYAFVARSVKDDSYHIYDGELKKESLSSVSDLRWVGNDTKLFFIGSVGDKLYAYFGNKKYGPFAYYSPREVSISPDGFHFAMQTETNNEMSIVSDSGTFGPYRKCYIGEWSAKGGSFIYEYEKDGALYHAVSGEAPCAIPKYYTCPIYGDDASIIFSQGKHWIGIRENDKKVYVKDRYIVTEYGLD